MSDQKRKYRWGRQAQLLMAIAALFLTGAVMHGTAHAANGSPVSGEPKEVIADMKALSEMREDAPVAVEFSKGEYIFVTEETEDWYTVFYQGSFLYIPKKEKSNNSVTDHSGLGRSGRSRTETASDLPKVSDIETDELTREFAEKAAANEVWADSLETQREAAKRAGIWRTAIIVGVTGIVIAVVASSIMRRKHIEPEGSEE